MLISPNSTLLFLGDSITDCGRAQPVGESHPWNAGGLGGGYVHFVGARIASKYPERNIRTQNVGLSGNTVRDLEARWDRDVLALSPNWLSMMIGINDVWRQFDSPLNPSASVDLETYRATLTRLLEATRPTLSGLVLMTPFFIEPNKSDAMRARMDEYGVVVKDLSARFDAIFVDTQTAFDRVLQFRHAAAIAWDRVHPGPAGHMVLADAWLAAVDPA